MIEFFHPPARTTFRFWHGALLAVTVALPVIAAVWYAQRKGLGAKTATSPAAGVEPSPPSRRVLRLFWIVAVLVGLEAMWDGWFIATELAQRAKAAAPDMANAAGPEARLVLGFLGGLAFLSGAQRLDLQDPERATRFLFRLAGGAVVLALTTWSRGSVAELMWQLAMVMLAAHFLRGFVAELTPRSGWWALGGLMVSALLFWGTVKFSRVGNLYAYQGARHVKITTLDVQFQMRSR